MAKRFRLGTRPATSSKQMFDLVLWNNAEASWSVWLVSPQDPSRSSHPENNGHFEQEASISSPLHEQHHCNNDAMLMDASPQDLPGYIASQGLDDDSVSTLGSSEVLDKNADGGSRSIFGNYWGAGTEAEEKDPHRSPPQRKLSAATVETIELSFSTLEPLTTRRISLDWSSYHHDLEEALTKKAAAYDPYGYEYYIKINEAGRTVKPSAAILNVTKNNSIEHIRTHRRNPLASCPDELEANTPRRKIFVYKYASTPPGLPSYEYKYRSSSSGQHTRKLLRSSLRRDRSSSISESMTTMEESMISQSTRLSVSFDPKVSIHEYTKPCESYIMDGWSNFFSR